MEILRVESDDWEWERVRERKMPGDERLQDIFGERNRLWKFFIEFKGVEGRRERGGSMCVCVCVCV